MIVMPLRVVRATLPQPAIGALLLVAGLLSTWLVWLRTPPGYVELTPQALGTMAFLAVANVASYYFPIHLRHQTKVLMVTTVYCLITVLVTPVFAAITAGLAATAGEISQRSRSGAYVSDIAAEVGRRVVMVLVASLIAHADAATGLYPLALLTSLLILALVDTVTLPLVIGPMSGDRPFRMLGPSVRATGLADGVQYLVGIVGAAAADTFLWTLPLLVVPAALVYRSFKLTRELHEDTLNLLESMADAVDLRDAYTGGHSRRVSEYSAAILAELGLQGPEVNLITVAARVHDIGKIGMPDRVLHKAGKLDDEERALMELHPEHGAILLKRYSDFARGVEMVLHHHEAWDGTGYPQKLRGMAIPFGARVIAVADSFDAMTSDRPYRKGMSIGRASQILSDGRGTQWDAAIVDAFLRSKAVLGADQEAPPAAAAAAQ